MTFEKIQHLDFEPSLRAKASAAYELDRSQTTTDLLNVAHELIFDILEEANASIEKIDPDQRQVILGIDGLRFRVSLEWRPGTGNEPGGHVPKLAVYAGSWTYIETLAALGKILPRIKEQT